MPTISGSGPRESFISTTLPSFREVPVGCEKAKTLPASVSVKNEVTLPGASPVANKSSLASSRLRPSGSGVRTCLGPRETKTMTSDCLGTLVPAMGSVLVTSPTGTSALCSCCWVTCSPIGSRVEMATSRDLPSSSGMIAAPPGPVENHQPEPMEATIAVKVRTSNHLPLLRFALASLTKPSDLSRGCSICSSPMTSVAPAGATNSSVNVLVRPMSSNVVVSPRLISDLALEIIGSNSWAFFGRSLGFLAVAQRTISSSNSGTCGFRVEGAGMLLLACW